MEASINKGPEEPEPDPAKVAHAGAQAVGVTMRRVAVIHIGRGEFEHTEEPLDPVLSFRKAKENQRPGDDA